MQAQSLTITDCKVTNAQGNALSLFKCAGTISGNTITGAADNALFALDSRLTIRTNIVAQSGNGGIRVWRSRKENDGSIDRRQRDRGYACARRRRRAERQRHQRVSRRRRDCARQCHPARRLLRHSRQCRLAYPRDREQMLRARRGRDLFRIRFRGCDHRRQFHRRRGGRHRRHQYGPGRPRRGGAQQHHPQSHQQAAAGRARIHTASASASRPIRWSPATESRTRR